ncbi:hypothetical protein LEP1GSC050_2667 [Leptospira broomii serovar Hurstbridge str. 5399]|nr:MULTISPECIES: hypothetical protein [Leptospira]EPG73956.1 hypothetical protein LEP1GSC058_2719 [Leptospira fainei serovar Hurstbridge str. BUT 6]EQA45427.1 hypothetical protein LEP1GSC050_2667 [Leptospira broomii serovar Hurstbridge str. 5399]PNV74985.1 hypothetical protein BES34_010460 [Leptospira inadai serovar Lyme]
MGILASFYDFLPSFGTQPFLVLAAFSVGWWTPFTNALFVVGISGGLAWYFYFYKRKDLLGGFWVAFLVALLGSLIILSIFQDIIRDIVFWLISPKVGIYQLSNVNLIAVLIGGYLALYIMNRINHNKERRD